MLIFGAFALRLWNLDAQSLWHDEAWSVMSAYQPLTPLDPNYPPYFTVLLGVWIRLAGDSVWAMRLWSALWGVLTVAAVAVVTRRWFGRRAAGLAALFATVSPPLWVFSQEIRSYVLVPLLVPLLLALLISILARESRTAAQSRRLWIRLALLEVIFLYVHNLAVPVVAWLNVTAAVVLIKQRRWTTLRNWVLVQAGLLILYLPWLITQRPTGTALNTPPTLDATLPWAIWQSYFTGIKALVGADALLMALTALFALATFIAALAVVARLVKNQSLPLLLLLSQAVLVPVFELIIILAAHIDFHPRYFLAGVPATLILTAVGLDMLAHRQPMLRLVGVGVAVLALAILGRAAAVIYGSPVYQHDDFRAIAGRYAALGPADAIVIPYGWEPTLAYYANKLHFRATTIGIPLHANPETVLQALQTALPGVQSAELLTWYQLPADVRGVYPCVMGTLGHMTTDSLVVSGLKTDRYTGFEARSVMSIDAPAQEKSGNAGNAAFRLLDRRALWGDQALCAMTIWQQAQASPTPENWRQALVLRNALGWELGKADLELLNDLQAPTSLWKTPPVPVTVFTLLNLPEGLPSQCMGSYALEATLYSLQKPHSAPLLVGTLARPADHTASVAPADSDQLLTAGVYLRGYDAPNDQNGQHLAQGQRLPVTLRWREEVPSVAPNTQITLKLAGDGWQTTASGCLPAQPLALTWHELRVPPQARGLATLTVALSGGKPTTLASYTIASLDRVFAAPEVTAKVDVDFVGVGTLHGVNAAESASAAAPYTVDVIWRAGEATGTAYTVFVHLLDADGQVIAQSDSQPAGGQRPTTGWLAGEYITDRHTLTWNRTDYTGPATLEVGLYNQITGERVKLANSQGNGQSDNSDHVVVPKAIKVH